MLPSVLQSAVRIRSLLLLSASVVLVPGLLAAVIAVVQVRQSEREAQLRGLRETVRATSLLVDGQILQSLGALTALANSQNLQTGNLAAFYEEAAAIDRPPDVWTILLDEGGTQLLNTAVPFGTPPPPPGPKERVAQVLATGKPLVSDLSIGPATGRLLTTLYVPAKASPLGRWVVAQAFSVGHWSTAVLQTKSHDDWVIAVIDRNGKFISRSRRTQEMLGMQARPELVAAAAAASSGLIKHSTLEGISSYDAFTHSALTGWTVAVAAPVASIEASASQAVLWLTSGLCIALAAAVAGAVLLSRTLIRAMDSASASARALGEGRRPSPRPTRVHEVNALNEALADAGALLERERSRRAVAELEREKLLASERAARELAQSENSAKDQFLALLGHELRNPLAAIGGAVELLARNEAVAPEPRRFVSIIQRQSSHLRRIVDDLLEIGRMLSGKLVLEKRPIDLAGCVRNFVDSLSMSEGARDHRLIADVDEVWVDGDFVRIEQIVSNLVGNALKFSAPGSRVEVSVRAAGNMAVFEVTDFGVGIENRFLTRIFEPFFQGPSLAGRQSSGLGIGLSLVRQLVELHGGTISVRSRGPGLGATFVVRLPRVERPVASNKLTTTPLECSRCHVLLVEDNDDARETTAIILRGLGYSVTEAADGDEAVQMARARVPAVVVMDLGLPGKTGLQVAGELKSVPALKHVPLIALSGYGQDRDKNASRAAGFADHLVKPVSLEALAAAIEHQVKVRVAADSRDG